MTNISAVKFLEFHLSGGPKKCSTLLALSKKNKITKKSFYHAARLLGVVRTVKGYSTDRVSTWSLSKEQIEAKRKQRLIQTEQYYAYLDYIARDLEETTDLEERAALLAMRVAIRKLKQKVV